MHKLAGALLAIALLIGTGCGDDASTASPGTEGNACYPNGTCNGTLSCLSNLCVDAGVAGTGGGGDGGTSGGGSGGDGGMSVDASLIDATADSGALDASADARIDGTDAASGSTIDAGTADATTSDAWTDATVGDDAGMDAAADASDASADSAITDAQADAGTHADCRPGHYEGNFEGGYASSLTFVGSPIPVSGVSFDDTMPALEFDLNADPGGGDTLQVSGGKMRGSANGLFPFVFDIVGEVNCATLKFTGELTNGSYTVGATTIPMSGPMTADYDPTTGSMVNGHWTVTEPGYMPPAFSSVPWYGGEGTWFATSM